MPPGKRRLERKAGIFIWDANIIALQNIGHNGKSTEKKTERTAKELKLLTKSKKECPFLALTLQVF